MVSLLYLSEILKLIKEAALENILVNNELIKLLKNIPGTTIWGVGIQLAFCTNYDPLLLLNDLRSQGEDDPEVLQSIIGQRAFDLLMISA